MLSNNLCHLSFWRGSTNDLELLTNQNINLPHAEKWTFPSELLFSLIKDQSKAKYFQVCGIIKTASVHISNHSWEILENLFLAMIQCVNHTFISRQNSKTVITKTEWDQSKVSHWSFTFLFYTFVQCASWSSCPFCTFLKPFHAFSGQGPTSCSILPSRIRERGVSWESMENTENMEKIHNTLFVNPMTQNTLLYSIYDDKS